MDINTVMTQLIVSDLETSVDFYASLFGRQPDARPMDRLAEWHFPEAGAIQVYQEPERAGRSGVTINVGSIDAVAEQLDELGVAHEPPMQATYVRVLQLADPDQNRIVFTQ